MSASITFDRITFWPPERVDPALDDIDATVAAGEVVLIVGPSGSGKSSLLRTVNGLVPHTTGGRFAGQVLVGSRNATTSRPFEMADLVGFVHQEPDAQSVLDHVSADVGFVLDNLGFDVTTIRRRVEEAMTAAGIDHLRDRSPSTLSGGERQRLAIAGALAAAPSVLALDEPTSQLDPVGADDVLSFIDRLVDDLGITVLLAEHRLERCASMATRAWRLERGRLIADAAPATVLADDPGAPPITRLGQLFGWDPPPLTIGDARRRLAGRALPTMALALDTPRAAGPQLAGGQPVRSHRAATAGDSMIEARGISVELQGRRVLHDVDLTLRHGEIIALVGSNGAGKTTLLRSLAGLVETRRGRVTRCDRGVAYVPQDPGALLGAATARDEIRRTLTLLGRRDDPSTDDIVESWLERLQLAHLADRHPRSLSTGERQRLAVAAVAVGGAPVLLLDEPTRGLDAFSRQALRDLLVEHAANGPDDRGGGAILATHDVELAATCATTVVMLGAGRVVAAGPAREVLAGSLFAPQIWRIMPPFLTFDEVERATLDTAERATHNTREQAARS